MTPVPARQGIKAWHLLAALGAAATAAVALSLLIGPTGIGIDASPDARALIFWEIRVPRAVLGALPRR